MKITVTIDERTLVATLPFPMAEHVEVQTTCPHCQDTPLLVSGKAGTGESTERQQTQDAICRGCGEIVGEIKVEFDTLFGITEDRRVLHGACKVY